MQLITEITVENGAMYKVDLFAASLSEELTSVREEVANDIEEKNPKNNETNTSPNLVDITKEQSFWDTAVLS